MASEDEQVMWELSTGLPLDGARVHVTGAEFGYRQDYFKGDAALLVLTFQPVDDDGDALEDQEPKEQYYSLGNKYEPGDADGTFAVHKSGKFVSFNAGSNIGRLFHSYVECRGKGKTAEDRYKSGFDVVREEGLFPHRVEMYLGLDVTLGGIPYEDQNGKERSTLGFTEYHGRIESGKKAKASSSKSSTKAKAKDDDEDEKPAKSTKAKASGSNTMEDVFDDDHGGASLIRKLKKAAIAAKDHDAFMDNVLEWDELTTDDKEWNKKAEKLMMDFSAEGFFASSRDDD